MAEQSINTIKNWFLTGKKPTEAQFADLFDSFIHKSEELSIDNIEGLEELLEAAVSTTSFTSHVDDTNAHGLSAYLLLSGERAMVGNLLFPTEKGIDTEGAGELNIGTENAEVINIGNENSTVNIRGTAVYELEADRYVYDKLFTLNYGGAADSAGGTGFEINEDDLIVGWFKTNTSRDGFDWKAPLSYNLTFDLSELSEDRNIIIPDGNGVLVLAEDLDYYVPFSQGDILYRFNSSNSWDLTNDGNGDYSKAWFYMAATEASFGYNLNYLAFDQFSNPVFHSGGNLITVPSTMSGTLALIEDLSSYVPFEPTTDITIDFAGSYSMTFDDLTSFNVNGTNQGDATFDAFTNVSFYGTSEGTFNVDDYDTTTFNGSGNGAFAIENYNGFTLDVEGVGGDIYMSSVNFTVSGNPGTFEGIKYDSDYSDELTSLSLVHRGFVEDNFVPLVFNGLEFMIYDSELWLTTDNGAGAGGFFYISDDEMNVGTGLWWFDFNTVGDAILVTPSGYIQFPDVVSGTFAVAEDMVAKLTGDVLFNFSTTSTLDITTDNGGFIESWLYMDSLSISLGWLDKSIGFSNDGILIDASSSGLLQSYADICQLNASQLFQIYTSTTSLLTDAADWFLETPAGDIYLKAGGEYAVLSTSQCSIQRSFDFPNQDGVLLAAGTVTSEVELADTTIIVEINGTSYKLLALEI